MEFPVFHDVMDYLWIAESARTRSAFANVLKRLEGSTAWMSGAWAFPDDQRPWSRLQNTNGDIRLLTDILLLSLSEPGQTKLETNYR
jgi:hypothetical protein